VVWLGHDSQLPFSPFEHPQCEDFHFRILHRIPGVNIAPLVLEATEIERLSPTPAPLLGSRKILEVRALLTIDRADLCGLSTVERTGSPVFHTLWSYVPVFIATQFLAGSCWSRDQK